MANEPTDSNNNDNNDYENRAVRFLEKLKKGEGALVACSNGFDIDLLERCGITGPPPASLPPPREPGEDDEPTTPGAVATRFRICNIDRIRDARLAGLDFVIDPLIPRDHVTLLGGHGGSGKTTLSYVLCAHIAAGVDWAGLRVMPGKCLVVSFEDHEDLMLWRFRSIADEYGLSIDAIIRNVKLIDATEAQPIMQESGTYGIKSVLSTPDGAELMAMITGEKYDLVQIDNASDAFDGNENSRMQVRKFIRSLAHTARVNHSALLLLAHIDKTAARYGSAGNSYSGSTAWHNSVRSRLALIDSALSQEKLNVGKRMESPIKLLFSSRGIPVPDPNAESLPDLSAFRMTSSQRIALDALAGALMREGVENNGVVSVAEDQWRKAAYDGGIVAVDATQDARKKAFQRARTDLVSRGKVACNEGRYWILPSGTNGTKRNINGPSRTP